MSCCCQWKYCQCLDNFCLGLWVSHGPFISRNATPQRSFRIPLETVFYYCLPLAIVVASGSTVRYLPDLKGNNVLAYWHNLVKPLYITL
ncbi:hypothetical protein T01_3262 [Trichinella spiralis]|uniref:Uncharacterized protein n=1 Tax=Trichinella spiralis TaxID=6334 RepID=A0A0V1BMC3_TRISP|nr:hypothetical protein T01_3262 [Trichinella spiralis]